MMVWAVVVAAGSGSRFGGLKQYERLGDRRVLDWAVQGARTVAEGVVIAVPADRAQQREDEADVVVTGAASRSGSVRAALAAVPPEADVIVVHDAARPLARPWLFRAVVDAVANGADGAVPGLPVSDTIKRVRQGVVLDTLERTDVVAVQTPQAFRASVLRLAHEAKGEGTDDASLVETVGGRVVVVVGDPDNAKLTDATDLIRARSRAGAALAPAPRVGMGFDVHPFSSEPHRRLVLGGVELEGAGLAGHSDADVVAHAVADALLGAAGQGDLGALFPDHDPAFAGADSLVLLTEAVELIAASGWAPLNVDCSVVAEAPRLAEHLPTMAARLTEVVGAPVSVKAKRAEGLGALGRREAVACWAVALVEPLDPGAGR